MLRPGFEETEENITNLMESRLEDHERIRGGLYFIQNIPRDENWKIRRDILTAYEPNKTGTGSTPADNIQELDRKPNGAFVAATGNILNYRWISDRN